MTETRAYRIDDADHYICLSLLLLRSILFYIVYLDDSALLQCRIGLISEVIVIGIYSDQRRQSYMPLFQSLFSQSYPLIFSQNVFALVYMYTCTFLWASTGQPSLFDSVNSNKTECQTSSTVQFSTVQFGHFCSANVVLVW